MTIAIEQLLATTEIAETSLFEITDHSVIARIFETIPYDGTEIAAKTITKHALKSAALYKVIIPSVATLSKSTQMEGAVRGFYHGTKGIRGNANLLKIYLTKFSKASSLANGVANLVNVSSLIVGQYYMSEIRLSEIRKTDLLISKFIQPQTSPSVIKVHSL